LVCWKNISIWKENKQTTTWKRNKNDYLKYDSLFLYIEFLMKKLLILWLLGRACLLSSVFADSYSYTFYSSNAVIVWWTAITFVKPVHINSFSLPNTWTNCSWYQFIQLWSWLTNVITLKTGTINLTATINLDLQPWTYAFVVWTLAMNNCNNWRNISTTNLYSRVVSWVLIVEPYSYTPWVGWKFSVSQHWWSTVDYDILPPQTNFNTYLNWVKIYTWWQDYYINYTGWWWYSTYLNSLTITWQFTLLPIITQGLITLNYTWFIFNIWTNYSPFVSWWVFYVPNPSEFTGTYTYLPTLTVTWQAYTWSLFANFTDSIWKIFFENLTTIIALLWWLMIAWWLFNRFRFRRK